MLTTGVGSLPVRWDGMRIIANDAVAIDAPYGSENCRAPSDKRQASLIQIKKVVDGFWAKNKGQFQKQPASSTGAAGRAPPATPVIRKGG